VEEGSERQRAQRWGKHGDRVTGQGCQRRVKGDGSVMGGGQQCGGGAVGAMGDCQWPPWRRWWRHGGGGSGKKYPLLMAKNVLGPD
jgi:hypothetical protein